MPPPQPPQLVPWVVVGLGLVLMYGPTFWDLFNTLWSSDEQGHGPIVLAISIWLVWRRWQDIHAVGSTGPKPRLAWVILVTASLFYVLGRSQGIYLFEVGSFIWTIAGLVLLLRGWEQLRSLWFALFFMLFMIPLPGTVVDALTQPMKLAVSYVAEHVLFWLGYPIARTGVILQVGPYQLLVADACAGLHTLFTLEALGLLYLNIVKHASVVRNATLAVLIVPISFTANVIRVMALTLITYYLGDEAGQGFLHGFAGMVLFMTALLLIMATDHGIRLAVSAYSRRNGA